MIASSDNESSQETLHSKDLLNQITLNEHHLGLHNKLYQQPKRQRPQCPIPGCKTKRFFARLANHIRNYHNIRSVGERRKWLAKAKENVRSYCCLHHKLTSKAYSALY